MSEPTAHTLQIAEVVAADTKRQMLYRTVSSDLAVIRQTFESLDADLTRLQRWPEISAWLDGLDKPPLIVDCGAYIGSTALYFHMQYPKAKIVALEPDPGNYELLVRNTDDTGIYTIPCGVGGENGSGHIERDDTHWSRSRLILGDGPITLLRINDIYSVHNDSRPFIVKVDIEGGELQLFSSNIEWVSRTPIIMMEPHDWLFPKQQTSKPFLQALSWDRPRDLIISGEYLISIAHDLNCRAA